MKVDAIDFPEIAAWRNRVIAASRQHVFRLLQHHQVDVYVGEASLSAPGRVCVRVGKLDPDGERIHYNGEAAEVLAEHIVLATGSQPFLPGFVQADNPLMYSIPEVVGVGSVPADGSAAPARLRFNPI